MANVRVVSTLRSQFFKTLDHVFTRTDNSRCLYTFVSFQAKKHVLPITASHKEIISPSEMLPTLLQNRQFFSLPSPLKNVSKRKEYSERRILGYSMEQMYNVVADVGSYHEFIPWCTHSSVFERRPNGCKAKMEVGFPPIKERYISTLKLVRPNLVHAGQRPHLVLMWPRNPIITLRNLWLSENIISECTQGILFTQLLVIWKFSPGIPRNPKTCTLDFSVVFEFRSQLHSKLATVFFDEIVRTMVKAFLKRAQQIYGPASIQAQRPKVLAHTS